jgi:hypothetical protein
VEVLRPPGETGAEVVSAGFPDAELVGSGVVAVAMGIPLLNAGVEGVAMEICDTELAAEEDGSWAPWPGSTVGPGGEELETEPPAM